ncbi:hypothetical protein [Hymenobacter frigidus]|uniref:hypothetical protein n=1 Tax=Hymenobacter frigidus TaxID=1524095 RepID=UPI00166525AA|nr:hypothetical protein [Hymenobacter frigidus]
MSKTTTSSVPHRTAYQRPYKTRQQRREADRRKTDESHDHKFLLRAGVGIAIVLAVVLGFMLKGLMDRDKVPAATVEMPR